MTTTQQGAAAGDGESVLPPPNSFAGIVLSIYNDLLSNALHEVVSEAHRAEKLLRTQQVQLAAAAEAAKSTSTSDSQDSSKPPDSKPAAMVVVGNPMAVFPTEIICPKCKLPRHTLDSLASSTGGKEDKRKYCSKLPYQNKPLHDIYGNPSPTVNVSAKEKKAKAVAAQQAAQAAAEQAAESTVEGGGDGGTPAVLIPNNGRKADSVVYFRCTNCSTEKIAASRFAAHLEKCLGLAGRKSSRAAMAKINGTGSQGGSGAGSPALGPVDLVGKGGNGSGKATPDSGEAGGGEVVGVKKEKRGSFAEEGGINVPPPPPANNIGGAVGLGTGKMSSVVTKKKKKPVAKDSAVAAAAAVVGAADDNKDSAAPVVKDESSQVAASTVYPPASAAPKDTKDPAGPLKKRKRKAESMANGDSVKGDSTPAADDKDTSITLARSTSTTKVPPLKKQKMDGKNDAGGLGQIEGLGSPVLKKSQLSKFKDRDSPGPAGLGKKGDAKRDSTVAGKFPPGRTSTPPPTTPAKPASPTIPAKHPPTGSPKLPPAKLVKKKSAAADGAMRKVKSSQGIPGTGSTAANTLLPNNRAGSLTPKIAKKSLPTTTTNTTTGVNVPPPKLAAGKTLPAGTKKSSPSTPGKPGGGGGGGADKKDKDAALASPEKMRKTMSNGSNNTTTTTSNAIGTTTPKAKPKLAKLGSEKKGAGGGEGGGGGGGGGKRVPGKRPVAVAGDGDGGAVARKRPKVGGD